MRDKKIVIIGGGGHAKVLIDAIMSAGAYSIRGILDPRIEIGAEVLGFPVLGGDDFLERKGIERNFLLALGMGSVKASDKRAVIYNRYKMSFDFVTIVHKTAYVARSARLGYGVQILAGAIIQPDVTIGENVIINTGAIVEHDCKISAHSHISLNAVLGGGVSVGGCSHIGIGAKILQGVSIGNNVTVGSGAVVTKDVGDGQTVCGIPAKEIDG